MIDVAKVGASGGSYATTEGVRRNSMAVDDRSFGLVLGLRTPFAPGRLRT